MKTKFLFIDTKKKHKEIKEDLKDLFLETFERPITDEQWEHFYLNSPWGQTVSFACYDGSEMIAHGGLIPQQLISKNSQKISYFLQTAIMVRKKHQAIFLFKELMDTIDSFVLSRKSFAVAFPNKKTYMPFIKMLQWRLIREYSIRQYRLQEGGGVFKEPIDKEDDFQYEIYKTKAFMRWRRELNKFEILKTLEFEIIYKDYNGSFEILDVFLQAGCLPIGIGDIIYKYGYQRVNIPECFYYAFSLNGMVSEGTIGIPQRMCVYPAQYKQLKYEEIKPSLLLSDVF